jgi:hypothetical protein
VAGDDQLKRLGSGIMIRSRGAGAGRDRSGVLWREGESGMHRLAMVCAIAVGVVMIGVVLDAEELYIPAAAHVEGVGGAQWRTDLEVKARGAWAASFRVEALKRRHDNSNPAGADFIVEPGATLRINDILATRLSMDGTAALRITPRSGRLLVSSRTYNDTGAGTYGQYIPAVDDGEAFSIGELATMIQLQSSLGEPTGYRTNIGFVNLTSSALDLETGLYDSAGTLIATIGTTLDPYGYDQLGGVFGGLASSPVDDGYAIVQTTTEGGHFLAYASVVDNQTGDAIYIPAQRDEGLTTDVVLGVEIELYNPDVLLSTAPGVTIESASIIGPREEYGDVTLRDMVVIPTRTDGGTVASPEWVSCVEILVPAGHETTMLNPVIYPAEYFDELPLSHLNPAHGGVDPETGQSSIRQSFRVLLFGTTDRGFSAMVDMTLAYTFAWE